MKHSQVLRVLILSLLLASFSGLVFGLDSNPGVCLIKKYIAQDNYEHTIFKTRDMIMISEVPRQSQMIGLYSGPLSDIFPGTFSGLIQKNVSWIIGQGIPNGYSFNISSFSSSPPGQDFGFLYLPRLFPRDLNLSIPEIYMFDTSTFNGTQSQYCQNVMDYLTSSRHIVYNNWRIARYSILLSLCLISLLAFYYNRKIQAIKDRRMTIILNITLGIIYSVLGLIFVNLINADFQGIEYLYYISTSVLYFSNFIRYAIKNIIQEKTVSFYTSLNNPKKQEDQKSQEIKNIGQILKNDSLKNSIKYNQALFDISSYVPRILTNIFVFNLVLIFVVPTIPILYYDILGISPYQNYSLSITILKFVVPITCILIPAIFVFGWSVRDFKKKMSILGDPLYYRREFLACLLIVLPVVLVTFVIGLSDSAIPGYVYSPRVILLAFHGIFYILFDLLFHGIISGLLLIVLIGILGILSQRGRRSQMDDSRSSGSSLIIGSYRKKMSSRGKVIQKMLHHKSWSGIVEDYSKVTGNYEMIGLRHFLLSLKNDSDIKNSLVLFVSLCTSRIIQDTYQFYLSRYQEISEEISREIINDMINAIEEILVSRLEFDNFHELDEYAEFYKSLPKDSEKDSKNNKDKDPGLDKELDIESDLGRISISDDIMNDNSV